MSLRHVVRVSLSLTALAACCPERSHAVPPVSTAATTVSITADNAPDKGSGEVEAMCSCSSPPPVEVQRITGVIPGIRFANQRSDLLVSGAEDISNIAYVLEKYPSVRILVRIHCDLRSAREGRQTELIQGRGAYIKAEIVVRGVSQDRIEVEVVGENEPLVPANDPNALLLNERIEIWIETL